MYVHVAYLWVLLLRDMQMLEWVCKVNDDTRRFWKGLGGTWDDMINTHLALSQLLFPLHWGTQGEGRSRWKRGDNRIGGNVYNGWVPVLTGTTVGASRPQAATLPRQSPGSVLPLGSRGRSAHSQHPASQGTPPAVHWPQAVPLFFNFILDWPAERGCVTAGSVSLPSSSWVPVSFPTVAFCQSWDKELSLAPELLVFSSFPAETCCL